MRLGDLAGREGVAAPTMSRIVSALLDAGYVRREPDPADRRAWLVRPTDEGERMVSELRSSRVQDLRRRMDRLTEHRRALLVAALPVLEELLVED